jgi:hypothetical protein
VRLVVIVMAIVIVVMKRIDRGLDVILNGEWRIDENLCSDGGEEDVSL